MSTPVVTNKWAGSFECGGPCRRKRLMAEEFSKKALEKHRKDEHAIRCKQCVAAAEQAEREAAADKKKIKNDSDNDGNETRKCAGQCAKELSKSAFNRNQWSKGDGKSRCRDCVEKAIEEESENQSKSKEEKIATARQKVNDLKKAGNAQGMLAAESELAALEAEKVTGLKPVRMSSGRGRGGRGGRGRGKRR